MDDIGTADARHKTPGISPLKRANGAAVAASDIALRPHSASFLLPYLLSVQRGKAANGVNKKLMSLLLQRVTLNSLKFKNSWRGLR